MLNVTSPETSRATTTYSPEDWCRVKGGIHTIKLLPAPGGSE